MVVKHKGSKYDVDLDPAANGETFKFQLFSLTGVEPDNQKILVRGGQLKNETELSTLKAKPKQIFMMMGEPSGSADSVVQRPKETIKFVEDMTEAELARSANSIPCGLENLGNTCYMNATLQVLRGIPELQESLLNYKSLLSISQTPDLVNAMKDLFTQMSETQIGFPPIAFLNALRQNFPQFAQRTPYGYAQQDAEEAWTQILLQVSEKLKFKQPNTLEDVSFVHKYMTGTIQSTMECDEPTARENGETAIESSDTLFKLPCHIGKDTNHLHDGIMAALTEQVEKNSPALGRNALYTKKSRLARLPQYLTVHFVRFFWKRDIRQKAKIMRKVTFPAELDIVEFCTDDLKQKLIPVRDKVREIRKEQEDFVRARKRQRFQHQRDMEEQASQANTSLEPLQKKKKGDSETKEEEAEKLDAEKQQNGNSKTDADYEAEHEASIVAAKKELATLIDPQLARDAGSNQSGLYELKGAVTHQGSSADSGHYTAYVKKHPRWVDDATVPGGKRMEEDDKWWWFNDTKVSEVDEEKIMTLAGGGE